MSDVSSLSEDLQKQINALKSLSQVHYLLQNGSYSLGYMPLVGQSVTFVESLHKQLIEEATKHPEASNVPELAPYIQKSEEVSSSVTSE